MLKRESAPQIPPAGTNTQSSRISTRCVSGLAPLAAHYDAFLVDQWGVLHDGSQAFPAAVDCLRRLVALGKQVVILSNSGKPAASNALRLRALGVGEHTYTRLITSGEVVRALLKAGTPPFSSALGRRCLWWNSDEDCSLLDGANLDIVETAREADFILLAGVAEGKELSEYVGELQQARDGGLPLICANPDTVRFSSFGLQFSAGEVARQYETMGGQVHYIGKPHPAIYQYSQALMPEVAPGRTLAVGDSLAHDVVGGVMAGIDTAFVSEGIHRADFADLDTEDKRLAVCAQLAREADANPHWLLERFQW